MIHAILGLLWLCCAGWSHVTGDPRIEVWGCLVMSGISFIMSKLDDVLERLPVKPR